MSPVNSSLNAPPTPPENSPYVLLLTTVGSREEAQTLAQVLVEERLAACVNYFAVQSVYYWQGAVQQDGEWQLILKTRLALKPAIEARLKALHSYELPECLVMPVVGGSEAYLNWLGSQLQTPSP